MAKAKRLKQPKKPQTLDLATLEYVRDLVKWYVQNCEDYASASLRSRYMSKQSKLQDAGNWYTQASDDLAIVDSIDDIIWEVKRGG